MNLFQSLKKQAIFFTVPVLVIFSYALPASLAAAPLEGGYSLAPKASASQDEKIKAFQEARYKVLLAAEKYENTPYRYGGLDRNGLDCSGLIYVSFRDALGVMPPRTTQGLYAWVEKIPRENAQPGDLLFFTTDNSGKISHAAIYIGRGWFIHSASSGPQTGVIYSNFDDRYWSRTFAGAGRAFPAANSGFEVTLTSVEQKSAGQISSSQKNAAAGGVNTEDTVNASAEDRNRVWPGRGNGEPVQSKSNLSVYAGLAPTWSAFLYKSELFRGFASQFSVGVTTNTFGPNMHFGFEIRPEYDGALGVFRLPFTFSWGPSDRIYIFAGPVLSFGDASLSIEGSERTYSGGSSWLGAAGITFAPFVFNTAGGDFAPYLETAWQSYFSENKNKNANADFSAGFRFSTGIRYKLQVQ